MKLKEKLKTILIALAIVIAVFLVYKFILPFKFTLVKKELNLNPTAIEIEDIEDIGQLITAEFYGEVVSSSNEYYDRNQNSIINDVSNFCQNDLPGKNNEKEFDTLESRYYAAIIAAWRELHIPARKFGNERDFELFKNFMRHYDWVEEFKNNLFKHLKEELKELDEMKVAYIARGKVLAGSKVDEFDKENQIHYCEKTKTSYILLNFEILGVEINPWFVYDEKLFGDDKGIKGFEVIFEKKVRIVGSEFAEEFTRNVKKSCAEKLKSEALRLNILEKARQSAQEFLGSLLTAFPKKENKIEHVVVVDADYFFKYIKENCHSIDPGILENHDGYRIVKGLPHYFATLFSNPIIIFILSC
jgi:hypothetical protein